MKKIMALLTAVFIVVLSVSPAFAVSVPGVPVDVPKTEDMQKEFDGGKTYVTIYMYEGGTYYYLELSDAPLEINSVNKYLRASTDLKYVYYNSYDNQWAKGLGNRGSLSAGQAHQGKKTIVYYTNYNLYDDKGNLISAEDDSFFPHPPLAEIILGVTAETLTSQTVPAVTGTMKTVVLCGVGCLALLTALVLLPKKFWMFLR